MYSQNEQDYINLVLPFKVINQIAEVLIYGKNPLGYQRELSKAHVSNIKKRFLDEQESKEILLPTSIILGVDRNYIQERINKEENSEGLIEVDIDLESSIKNFRVVDGQHRLQGLEEAAKFNEDLNNFMLNVVILVTNPNNRVIEVEVFRDINSKAKRVKTDLTTLAIYNYELLGHRKVEDIDKHLSIKTAYYLSEKIKNTVWNNAIKFDIHSKNNSGIINLSPFINSIMPIVKNYVHQNNITYYDNEEVINQIDFEAEKLAEFINRGWEIVRNKWRLCFEEKVTKDVDDSYIKAYYNSNYYLQKTTGTSAINDLLKSDFEEFGFSNEAFHHFEEILSMSQVKSEDWMVGGPFSGLTSRSGFKKAQKYILNDLSIYR